jgi:hypothetical protein
LPGLQTAIGADVSTRPAIFEQKLDVLPNSWFGVEGGREVTVVWVYLNDVKNWRAGLSDEVAKKVDSVDKFPGYSTESTELNATEFNLLASVTAWSVANDDNASTFINLFQQS